MDVIINNANPGTPVQVVPQQAVPSTYGAPYGYGYGPMSRDHGGFPGFLPVLLILGAVLFFRRRRQGPRGPRGEMGGPSMANLGDEVRETFRRGRARFVNDGALDIARERYARGEINADEYETLRRTLSGEGPRPAAGGDEGMLKL